MISAFGAGIRVGLIATAWLLIFLVMKPLATTDVAQTDPAITLLVLVALLGTALAIPVRSKT